MELFNLLYSGDEDKSTLAEYVLTTTGLNEASNLKWLQQEIIIPREAALQRTPKKLHRPLKPFAEISKRQKLRRIKSLVSEHPEAELTFAASVSLSSSGKRDAAYLLKEATQTTPTRATKFKRAYKHPASVPVPYTPLQALALFVNARMTKFQYNLIRQEAKQRHCNIYPSYDKLKKEKVSCYPPRKKIQISDMSAEIELQALIDHTVTRITTLQESIFSTVSDDDILRIIIKWGCDGSSGYSNNKQMFNDTMIPSFIRTISISYFSGLKTCSQSGFVKYCTVVG